VLAQSTCSLNGKNVPCDQMMEGAGIFFVVFMALFFIFMIAITVFWVMMLIHAIKNQGENKVVWILVLIFTSGLGAIIYYFMEKRPMDKVKKLGNQNNNV
jgi:hypothetical protein